MQQDDSKQDGIDDPQDLKHRPAADSDSAAPGDARPFTPRLKRTQGGLILPSLYKAIIGNCIQPEMAGMVLTVFLSLHEKFHCMGRKAVHIERYKETYHIRFGEQLQYPLKILAAAKRYRIFWDTRKKQPE